MDDFKKHGVQDLVEEKERYKEEMSAINYAIKVLEKEEAGLQIKVLDIQDRIIKILEGEK